MFGWRYQNYVVPRAYVAFYHNLMWGRDLLSMEISGLYVLEDFPYVLRPGDQYSRGFTSVRFKNDFKLYYLFL